MIKARNPHILVSQKPTDFELPERPLGKNSVIEGLLDFFDRDQLFVRGFVVYCCDDESVGAFADY